MSNSVGSSSVATDFWLDAQCDRFYDLWPSIIIEGSKKVSKVWLQKFGCKNGSKKVQKGSKKVQKVSENFKIGCIVGSENSSKKFKKVQKRTQTAIKGVEKFRNGSKKLKMVLNGAKKLKMVLNGSKRFQKYSKSVSQTNLNTTLCNGTDLFIRSECLITN